MQHYTFCGAATAVLLIAACRAPSPARFAASLPDSAAVRLDIAHLASDSLEGRRTGTAGNDSAAAWLARRHEALGLKPGVPGYLQRFTAMEPRRNQPPLALPTQNVVAVVVGSDPALRDEYVVLGAHFDHLGRSTEGALDPEKGAVIHPGADDNASGTAAILALARRFERHPAKRSILLAHFSGEEEGLLGSGYFVDRSPVSLTKVVAMLNFDMVGRLRDDRVIIYGVATAAGMKELLDTANSTIGLKLSAVGDGFGPSDQSSFYSKDLPVLHFFTDVHEDYHRATDRADRIDVAGLVRVVDLAERAARIIADRRARLTFTRAPVSAAARATSERQGSGVYFGSIPDMGAGEGEGMKLSGVNPGGPADKAGLKGGDVIVEFGGTKVSNIYDYTDALGVHQPGDVVSVVFVRGNSKERHTVSVTLGRRGG